MHTAETKRPYRWGVRLTEYSRVLLVLPWLLFYTVGAQAEDDLDFLFGSDTEEQEQAQPEPDAASSKPEPNPQDASTTRSPAEQQTPKPEPTVATIPVQSTDEPERPSRPQIEEIIVTAQKREQALADVPISVSAISGEKLADAGIENLSDLSEYAPNFKLVDSGLIPNIYMRGVGSGSNQGFELSVGIFSDGIHLGRPHQTRAAFMDLQRAEVLRGPQSILFGKNAIAGALNLVSAQPGDDFEMQFSTTQGLSDETEEYTGFISGPITDTFGARFAFRTRSEEGYLFNILQNRMEPGLDEQSGRLTLDWDVTDFISSSLKVEATTREQRGRTFETTDPGAITGCTGENVVLDRIRVTDATELADIESWNATLSVDVEIGPGELNIVSGYSGFESSDLFDADSSSIDTLDLLGVEEYDQLSQEIRYAVEGDQFDYIFGAFYQSGDLSFFEFGPTIARAGALADAGDCNINQQTLAAADLERDFSIVGDAWSVFAQGTWYATQKFRVTGGIRFVKENKRGFRQFQIFEPGTRDPANAASIAALNQLLINEHTLNRERDVDVYLPSLNFQYDITDDGMAYLAYTRGAKSGSYDARNNNGNTDAQGGATLFEFDDEIADAYELGSKLKVLGGSAELNLALFTVDYQDMQVSVFDGVAGFVVTNAGSARVQGVEMDGRWLLTESLMLLASAAWLDFEWTDYVDGPCFEGAPNEDPDTGTCDLTGQENQQTPKYSASLGIQYDQNIWRDLNLSIGVDANYRDAHFISGDLDPRGRQPSHTKYNARLAINSSTNNWSLAIVGKNLSDELVAGIGAPTALDIGGYRVATEPERAVLAELRLGF